MNLPNDLQQDDPNFQACFSETFLVKGQQKVDFTGR